MLRFFRKIRRNLLSDNTLGKYILYAVGEIVLVVLGILIALQINTWNEHRNNDAKILSFYKEVQTDLLKDIANFETIISSYKLKDSLTYLVLNNTLTPEDYKNQGGDELLDLITYYRDF